MKLSTIVCLSVLMLGVVYTICDAGENEQMQFENMLKQPEDHWYDLKMMGMKMGYIHIFLEKTKFQGEDMIRSRIDRVMQLKGGKNSLKIQTTLIDYSDSNFKPRYFMLTSNESGEKNVEGEVRDGTVYVTTTLNGEVTESEIEIPDDTISDTVAVNYLLFNDKMKIGEQLNYQTFSLEFLQTIPAKLSVLEETTIKYQSEDKQVYMLEQELDFMGGINTRLWVTQDGTSYKSIVNMMGVSMEVTKTDRDSALEGIEELEIVLNTRIIPTGKKLKPGASHLTANVKLSTGNLNEAILTNERQQLKENADGSANLSIAIPKVDENHCLNLPINDPELAPFLSATAYIETTHPDIRSKSVEIIDGEVNSWRAAKKLSNWVYKSISDKQLSGGFNSSLKTLESLAGDCTEHTVLLIAMARSVGIPARICAGLIFSRDAFYYHFWPEVYVGRWVQMDPSVGQNIADANHIQLQGGILESNTMVEFTEGVFRTLNQLDIDVLD